MSVSPSNALRLVQTEPGIGESRATIAALGTRAAGVSGGLERLRGFAWSAAQAFLFPALLLALWTMASRDHWISPKVLPDPSLVLDTFRELLRGGDLQDNLTVSLLRVFRGFLLGGSIGLALGLAMGFSPGVDAWIGPLFRAVTQIPPLAWIPLLMQVLGIDDALKLAVMAKACLIPVAITTAAGIREIPREYHEVARVLRLPRLAQIQRIVLPAALPSIFSGLRQGLGHVWVSLIIVEMMASADGIGYLMSWGRLIFQLDIVIVAMVVVGVVGFSFDWILRGIEILVLRRRGSDGYR